MKFGTGNRADMVNAKENQHKPGPGNYEGDASKTIKSAPSYGFGSS